MKTKRTENERSRPYMRIRTATKKHMFELNQCYCNVQIPRVWRFHSEYESCIDWFLEESLDMKYAY